jgi:hypothetical protein
VSNLPLDVDYDGRQDSGFEELLALHELRRNLERLAPSGPERCRASMALTHRRNAGIHSVLC